MHDLVTYQRQMLLNLGRRVVPNLTSEDLLQPNDYPSLESHPHFRYEEGILAGIQMVQSALQALQKRSDEK
jgi:hypothetical protein